MKRRSNLSENLKAYQKMRGCTQAELSQELGVPKSTLQALLSNGNTTLDTLLHLADALEISLDELVYDRRIPELYERVRSLMFEFTWYSEMTAEQQEAVWYHVRELIRLMKQNRDKTDV